MRNILGSQRWAKQTLMLGALLGTTVYLGHWAFVESWPAQVEFRSSPESWPLGFSPDGGTFVTGSLGRINLWDRMTGEPQASWTIDEPDMLPLFGAFAPDGKTFAVALRGRIETKILLIATATGRTMSAWPTHYEQAYWVQFTPDGQRLVFHVADRGGFRGVVSSELRDGKLTQPLEPSPLTPGRITIASLDGRLFLEVDPASKTMQLRDEREMAGQPRVVPLGSSQPGIVASSFSNDCRSLALSRENGTIEFWDIDTGCLSRTLGPLPNADYAVYLGFSPDGRTIATQVAHRPPNLPFGMLLGAMGDRMFGIDSQGGALLVIDIATGKTLARSAASGFGCFAPDGGTVVTRTPAGVGAIQLRDLPGRQPFTRSARRSVGGFANQGAAGP